MTGADLFTPLSIGDVEAPNRVMVSPMCQYSCEAEDGLATGWHHTHLRSRAVGGAGLVMTEATAVTPRGRISPQDLGLWSDAHAEALSEITAFVREQGSVPGVQLAHAGRKASKSRPWEGSEPLSPEEGGWETVAPSGPYPYDGDRDPPATRTMDQSDVETVVEAFARGASLADDAGFEVVELHAAHGYLLHEFLSPVSNDRTDDYGGDFADRTRLLREVTEAVTDRWPASKGLFVRISATDWLPDRDGWTVEDSVRLSKELPDAVDLMDVSAGGLHPDQQVPTSGPGYQERYASRIRRALDDAGVDRFVGAVGGITTPQQADALLRNARADLAIVGREHLRDPYFALHAAEELDAMDRVEVPVQYNRGF